MEKLLCLVLLFVLLSEVESQGQNECCVKGDIEGRRSIDIDGSETCPREAAFMNAVHYQRGLSKFFCRAMFSSCCKTKKHKQYCERGINDNSACASRGDKLETSCCECCLEGEKMGARGGSCTLDRRAKQNIPAACRYYLPEMKFKSCCQQAKRGIFKKLRSSGTKPTAASATLKELLVTERRPDVTERLPTVTTRRVTSRLVCRRGYELKDGRCVDTDECKRGRECRRNYQCVNRPGSYICKRTACESGLKLSNGACVDINECSDVGICGRTSEGRAAGRCTNLRRSYRCYCVRGYRFNRHSKLCEDVDECQSSRRVCAHQSQCVNRPGTYMCKRTACESGWKLSNDACVDINECSDVGICGRTPEGRAAGKCRNVRGSYRCYCGRGYRFNRDSKLCEDVDECPRGACAFKCENTAGSYKCSCPPGYLSTAPSPGRTSRCIDKDECLGESPCPAHTSCTNTLGSFGCVNSTCPAEFLSSEEPATTCRKRACMREMKCLAKPVVLVKTRSFRYRHAARAGIFRFTYSMRSYSQYRINFYIASGNEDGIFNVRLLTSYRAQLTNRNRMQGPKQYRLRFHTDVMKRGATNRLSKAADNVQYRFVYYFDINVSAYKF